MCVDGLRWLFLGDMEESCCHTGKTPVLVVDESIKQKAGPFRPPNPLKGERSNGLYVIIGNGGRNKAGMTLTKDDLILGGTDLDATRALEAHGDDEGVVLDQIAMEALVNIDYTHIEELRVNHMICGPPSPLKGGVLGTVESTILVMDLVVEGLSRQFGVELTRLAVHSWAIVVKDAIGDVTRLLHLGQEDAATDGMDASGRNIEDVSRMNLVLGESIGNGTILHLALVLLGGKLLLETGIEIGSRFGIDDVPHLGLPELIVFAKRHLVVRMHLNGEVFLGIDELDEQGQLVAILLGNGTTQDLLWHLTDDIDERLTRPSAIVHDGRGRGNSRDFPGLANRGV